MTLRTEFMAAAFVVAALGISAAPANAVTFSVIGKDAATSTAEIDFTYDGISQLTLGITNTESASADPRITSFAFNLPSVITGASFASVSGTQDDSKWVLQLNNDGINTPGNLGQFDIAGVTGPNFNGGSPNFGIAQGDTGTFVIDFAGDAMALASLTEMSFLDLLSSGGKEAHEFAVRFQRLDVAGGSDVAVGGPNPIPLPASALFLLSSIGGIGFLGWRRRQGAASGGA